MNKRKPHQVDVHVGARVKMRRMLEGLSQGDLGKALGLTFQQVQKYEKGVNRISASRLWEIAHILGVPVSFFYDGLNATSSTGMSDHSQDEFANMVNSTEGLQLNRHFIRINDARVRRKILDLVKTIASSQSE